MLIRNIIFITFISANLLLAEEKNCPSIKDNISAHLISDGFYNYQEFLHYSLGKFSTHNQKNYNLNVANELDLIGIGSDIIFGEYNELKKIISSEKKLITPDYIKEFYIGNKIKNSEENNNLYPLDLDTYILVSNNKIKNITHEEDIYNSIDPNKYTLSQSFYSENETINFLNYLLMNNEMNFDSPFLESILFNQKKKYSLINKNTFLGSYEEITTTFHNEENLYAFFHDGYAYRENLEFINYPNSELIWDKKLGRFVFNEIKNITSFFGFSALVNKKNGYSFLCYLTKKETRDDLIRSFDLGVSPLSINDVINSNDISIQYEKLLELKNQNIKKFDTDNLLTNQDDLHKNIIEFIIGQSDSILTNQEINYFKQKN